MQYDELVKENARLQAEVEQWKANNMANAWAAGELVKILRGQRDALKAEVERLNSENLDYKEGQERYEDLCEQQRNGIRSLQAELTKARELIADMVKQQVEAGTDYTADVRRAKAYLSNQSAPADKGHGVPVAWAMKPGLDRISVNPKASHAVFGHSGEPGWDVPLYAEPPAPVAVILPKRISADDLNEIAQGWNCCLDAVERLNP